MVPPLEESEDGNRASFPRWGKRSVISSHFTELALEITEMGMLTTLIKVLTTVLSYGKKDEGCFRQKSLFFSNPLPLIF